MDLVGLAINLLWLLIGIIIIAGVVWLVLFGIKQFVPIPMNVERGVWLIVLILIIIAALSTLSGRASRPFRLGMSTLLPMSFVSTSIHHA